MGYRATLSCDQPGCTTSLTAPAEQIEFELRIGKWTVEKLDRIDFYTCPHHEPDTLSMEVRQLASAGRALLAELRDLDDSGYYVCGLPNDGGGALLQVRPYDYDDTEGPFVVISQSGRSFRARLMAGDDEQTVLVDEDSEEWD